MPTARNRFRILVLFGFALITYIITALVVAVATALALGIAVAALGINAVDSGDSIAVLIVVVLGVVAVALVIGIPVQIFVSIVRIPRLRRHLEARLLDEAEVTAPNEDHHQVENLLAGLAISSGLPAPRFALISDAAPNSFGIGTRPHNTLVAVTTGLIAILTRDELEAVLAYEVSRIASYDIALATWTVALTGRAIDQLDNRSDIGGEQRAWMGGGIRWFAERLQLWALKGQARDRDQRAIAFTRHPHALVRALVKLAADQSEVSRVSRATAPLWLEFPSRVIGHRPSPMAKKLVRELDLTHRIALLPTAAESPADPEP